MILAYHFTNYETLRDGRPIPPRGVPLIHEGPLSICESGLHASIHPFDALRHAPGFLLHSVACESVHGEYSDKLVCSERTILQSIGAKQLILKFARDQALSVSRLWPDMPLDVLRYLEMGENCELTLATVWEDLARTRGRSLRESPTPGSQVRAIEAAWLAACSEEEAPQALWAAEAAAMAEAETAAEEAGVAADAAEAEADKRKAYWHVFHTEIHNRREQFRVLVEEAFAKAT